LVRERDRARCLRRFAEPSLPDCRPARTGRGGARRLVGDRRRRARRRLELEPRRIARRGGATGTVGAGPGLDRDPDRRPGARPSRRGLAESIEPGGSRHAAPRELGWLGGGRARSRRRVRARLFLAARGWRAMNLHGLHLDLSALSRGTPALAGLALLWIG